MNECSPITKPVRELCEAHLARLRTLRCCVPRCRTIGCDAHHLTHVQPKARGRKAGDQWTVPMCRWHHIHCLHAMIRNGARVQGREGDWWRAVGLDPIPLAMMLWAETNGVVGEVPWPGWQ